MYYKEVTQNFGKDKYMGTYVASIVMRSWESRKRLTARKKYDAEKKMFHIFSEEHTTTFV